MFRARRGGSNRRRMAGAEKSASAENLKGARSALLDSTRTFTKPMSLAYSRKHCLQMFRLYLRMIPHWFAQTRLRKESERGGNVSVARRDGGWKKQANPKNNHADARPARDDRGDAHDADDASRRSRRRPRARRADRGYPSDVARARTGRGAEAASARVKTRVVDDPGADADERRADAHQRRCPLPVHSALVAQMLAKPMFARKRA